MKDIEDPRNYREKFKRHYGIDFSRKYVVHHIDFDRSNNDISNLLLLPNGLHAKYHMCVSVMHADHEQHGPRFCIDGRIRSANFDRWYLSMLEHFSDAMQECGKWYDYKSYLDGLMPNIHGITLD